MFLKINTPIFYLSKNNNCLSFYKAIKKKNSLEGVPEMVCIIDAKSCWSILEVGCEWQKAEHFWKNESGQMLQ